jgi:hypothetical protein
LLNEVKRKNQKEKSIKGSGIVDTIEIAVLIGGVALIGFTHWFFFGSRDEEKPEAKPGQILYACPMHPWITSPDPAANCSICGMKLVRPD